MTSNFILLFCRDIFGLDFALYVCARFLSLHLRKGRGKSARQLLPRFGFARLCPVFAWTGLRRIRHGVAQVSTSSRILV